MAIPLDKLYVHFFAFKNINAMSYRLTTTSPFISPFWLRAVQGKTHLLTLGEDGTLLLEGERLVFDNPDQSLPAGSLVRVWLNRYFECETQQAYLQREAQLKTNRAEKEHQERLRRNKLRDEALKINASIHLPVAWQPAIKDVLSGLSSTSWGDGRNKATVQHILLPEGLQQGRLLRDPGDLLCTSRKSSNGKQWCDGREQHFTDGDGHPYRAPVTCKKCLALALKIKA